MNGGLQTSYTCRSGRPVHRLVKIKKMFHTSWGSWNPVGEFLLKGVCYTRSMSIRCQNIHFNLIMPPLPDQQFLLQLCKTLSGFNGKPQDWCAFGRKQPTHVHDVHDSVFSWSDSLGVLVTVLCGTVWDRLIGCVW